MLGCIAGLAVGTAGVAAAGDTSIERDAAGRPIARVNVTDEVAEGRCRLPPRIVDAAGVAPGQQVLLERGGVPAAFTVEVVDGRVGYVAARGRSRMDVAGYDGSFRVSVDSTVVDPIQTAADAADVGGYVEHLADAGATSLVAIAPHGGWIEWGTDSQAERVRERLGATAWRGEGYWPGGGAFQRWHVTSTAVHPASYPALGEIADRGFDRAVSFHGWTGDHVAVGGAAPRRLRASVRDAIAAVVDCDVRLPAADEHDGDSPANVVNWLTDSGRDGVQIEQPWSVRSEARQAVADAVSDVYAEL